MNQAEFARLHGVSRKTATKWKEKGWLVLNTDGSVNVDDSNKNVALYRTPEGKARGVASGVTIKKSGNKKVTPSIHLNDGETPEEAARRLAESEQGTWTIEEAKRVKENYLALLNQLDYDLKSGAMVDLATAESVLFESARAQRDSWLNWPARVGPTIAAEFGVEADRMTEVLTGYVHKQIETLGEPEFKQS